MKRFIINIIIILGICLAWQVLGEYVYTYIYNNGTARNKVMWVRSLNNTQMDFAVLGSSRAEYHVDPLLIEAETGLIGYNFGDQNSYPFEIDLLSRELLMRTSVDRLLVQVDYTYNMDQPDVEASIPWMPYLKEAHIYPDFEPHDAIYKWFRHVPFYRYQYFEGELGIRNVVMSALGKQPDFFKNRGFKPIKHQLQELEPFEHYLQETENQSLKSVKQLCDEQGVETTFFISPIRAFKGNMPLIKNYLPEVIDYTDLYKDKALFSDPIHLKANGARLFTQQLIQDVFQK